MSIFDPQILNMHRQRALVQFSNDPSAEFILLDAAENLLDRLNDITRDFPLAMDIGAHTGQIARLVNGKAKIGQITSVETTPELAARCPEPNLVAPYGEIPADDNSLDLILSCLSLHWVNDIPQLLSDAYRALKPGGLFLATLPGEETLFELRDSFSRAELNEEGGVSARVAPMITIKDSARLLQAAGFIEPVADRDRVIVDYPQPLKLMHDLRAMGETNPMLARRKTTLRRKTLMAAMSNYVENYSDLDRRVLATFDLVTMTAWKPDPSVTTS